MVEASCKRVEKTCIDGIGQEILFAGLRTKAVEKGSFGRVDESQGRRAKVALKWWLSSHSFCHDLAPLELCTKFLLSELAVLPDEKSMALTIPPDGHEGSASLESEMDQLYRSDVFLTAPFIFVVEFEGRRVFAGFNYKFVSFEGEVEPDAVL